jgi:hypothetical protein
MVGAWLSLGGCGFVHESRPDGGEVDADGSPSADANTGTGGADAAPGTGGDDAAPGTGQDGGATFCDPGAALRCDGDDLISCDVAGEEEVRETCPLRCNDAEPACEDVAPSNGFADMLDAAATQPSLVLASSTGFNTESNVTIDGDNVTATIGGQEVLATLIEGDGPLPDVLVLAVGGLTLNVGVTIQISGERAVAIMSDGDVVIGGTLITRAGGSVATREACWGGDTQPVGPDDARPGAGGGGFGGQGGNGGSVLGVSGGGGKARGDTIGNAQLVPLRGGCRGGEHDTGTFGIPGGALQITSRTAIRVNGHVSAPGGGGSVTAGGGSGGGVLLEAPEVSVAGGVFVNGGGGGCGGFGSGQSGSNDSTDPAPGHSGSGCLPDASGGDGGSLATPARSGTNVDAAAFPGQNAAAGGGGVGRIRINTIDGAVGGGTFSPLPSAGVLATR